MGNAVNTFPKAPIQLRSISAFVFKVYNKHVCLPWNGHAIYKRAKQKKKKKEHYK